MDPQKFLKNGKVNISAKTYAIVKSNKMDLRAFANIVDSNETTVVIDQTLINLDEAIEIEKEWKLLTFEMVIPFELIGFISVIAQALAKEGVSIFALSAYSTDHILLKEKDLEKALGALLELGCQIDV
jgi:hypothetical protein